MGFLSKVRVHRLANLVTFGSLEGLSSGFLRGFNRSFSLYSKFFSFNNTYLHIKKTSDAGGVLRQSVCFRLSTKPHAKSGLGRHGYYHIQLLEEI